MAKQPAPAQRLLALPFQTSSTRCWVNFIEEDRFDQVWRALHVGQRFYVYTKDADDPSSAMFVLQDRDFLSEEEFKQFGDRLREIICEANRKPCEIELAYCPAGSVAPKFHIW